MSDNNAALCKACKDGDGEAVNDILDKGDVDINEEYCNRTPLMYAMLNNHLDIVTILLNHPELRLDKRHRNHSTALHWACDNDFVSVIRLVCHLRICSPGIINMKNNFGETLLMVAVRCGNLEIVKELDKVEGSDWRTKDIDGNTLIDMALNENKAGVGVLEYLTERNKKVDSLVIIAAYRIAKYVKKESGVEALEIPHTLRPLVFGFLDDEKHVNGDNEVDQDTDIEDEEEADDVYISDDDDYLDMDDDAY